MVGTTYAFTQIQISQIILEVLPMKKVLSTIVAAFVALSFTAVVFAADVAAPAAPAAPAAVEKKECAKPCNCKKTKKHHKHKKVKEAAPAAEAPATAPAAK
jgi:Spy/CpxP family protein refolding chaperone